MTWSPRILDLVGKTQDSAGDPPPPAPSPSATGGSGLLAGRTLDDFTVGRLLGVGGMAEVYLARQRSVDREVALKVMPCAALGDPTRHQRFLNEARAAALLDSPHVVRIFSTVVQDDLLAIAMEYVDGGNLAEAIAEHRRRGTRYTPLAAAGIVLQAARGLQAAHLRQLVHRDLKPANLMLTREGTVKLGDFGLVKFLDGQSLTVSGTVVGTPLYMAPEQGRGLPPDVASDIYSLGVVLYELLTLRLPFAGDTAEALIFQHNFAEPPLPGEIDPDIPGDLQAICLKCLQKAPQARFADVAALVADLERIQGGFAPLSAQFPAGKLQTGAKEALSRLAGRRRRWPVLLAGGLVVAAAGLGWWWWDARKLAVATLRARLAPLSVQALVPATADQDLAALARLAGTDDPQVAQGQARLAGLAAAADQLADRLARPGVLTAREIATLGDELDRLAAARPDEQRLAAWRHRLVEEQAAWRADEAALRRLVGADGVLGAPARAELAALRTALAAREALTEALAQQAAGRLAEAERAIGVLVERLAVLDRATTPPPEAAADLDRLAALVGSTEARVQAWRGRLATIAALVGRLRPLDAPAVPPPQAAEDLARLTRLVGADDPQVAGWTARLAAIARRRSVLAERLDQRQVPPADAAVAIDALAELVGGEDPDVLRWRRQLAEWTRIATALTTALAPPAADAQTLVGAGRLLAEAAAIAGAEAAEVVRWRRRLADLTGPQPAPAWAAASGRDGHGPWVDLVVGSARQRLRWLPPGVLVMGSPADEAGRDADETQVRVQLTRGCWIAETECSQDFWTQVTGSAAPGRQRGGDLPVSDVSAVAVEGFLELLSGRIPGLSVRLPSEAEWEAAARAGREGAWGGLSGEQAAVAIIHDAPGPAVVGSGLANPLGLRHMTGNLWEWCQDRYGPPPAGNPAVDPLRREGGEQSVRGGSWAEALGVCRIANRRGVERTRSSPLVGFRIAVQGPHVE